MPRVNTSLGLLRKVGRGLINPTWGQATGTCPTRNGVPERQARLHWRRTRTLSSAERLDLEGRWQGGRTGLSVPTVALCGLSTVLPPEGPPPGTGDSPGWGWAPGPRGSRFLRCGAGGGWGVGQDGSSKKKVTALGLGGWGEKVTPTTQKGEWGQCSTLQAWNPMETGLPRRIHKVSKTDERGGLPK